MGIKLSFDSYADFQVIVNSLPFKLGTIYYRVAASGAFIAVTFSEDWASAINISQPTLPSTFTTDYPNAIQLTDSQLVLNSNNFTPF